MMPPNSIPGAYKFKTSSTVIAYESSQLELYYNQCSAERVQSAKAKHDRQSDPYVALCFPQATTKS